MDDMTEKEPEEPKTPTEVDSPALFATLVEKWEARIRDTPERAKVGGCDYVGGLIDAYSACLEELHEVLEANAL